MFNFKKSTFESLTILNKIKYVGTYIKEVRLNQSHDYITMLLTATLTYNTK